MVRVECVVIRLLVYGGRFECHGEVVAPRFFHLERYLAYATTRTFGSLCFVLFL